MSGKKTSEVVRDIKKERRMAESKFDSDLDRLWKILKSATPDQQKAIMDKLDEKTLNLLRVKGNPYKKPIYKGHGTKVLAFNLINLREKYYQRFAMTGLIAFIYRMLDEWEPPCGEKLVSQNDPEFANIFNAKSSVLEKSRPDEIYRSAIADIKQQISDKLAANGDPESNDDKVSSAKELLQLYQKLYVEQARLAKFTLYHIVREKEPCEERKKLDKLEMNRIEVLKKLETKRKEILEIKLDLRKKFEGTEEQKSFLELYNKMIESERPTFEDISDEFLEDPKKVKLSMFDKAQDIDIFEKQIINKTTILQKIEDNLVELTEKYNKSNTALEELTCRQKHYTDQVKSLKEMYEGVYKNKSEKAAASQTQGKKDPNAKKRLRQRVKKIGNPIDDIKIKDYELTDDEYDTLVAETKEELGITTTKEEFYEEKRGFVQSFLDEYLLYNPDNHVQCAYKPNYDDKYRTPLAEAWVDYTDSKITEGDYQKVVDTVQNDIKKMRVITEEKYERSIIPPDDTFFRLRRYIDNNYEELRQATDDIYCEKSDIEFSIVPLNVFEGNDQKAVEAEALEWQRKYADEFESDVYRATFGIHNLMSSWEQNRDSINFYTKESEVLQRIIEKTQEDEKMGRDLMKQRTEKEKKKNVEKEGEDDPGLAKYRKSNASGLNKLGAKHASEIDSNITKKQLNNINREDESSQKEIEVDFYNIQPRGRSRKNRMRGKTTKGKFHIPSEDKPPETTSVMKPTDMQKHLAVEEMKDFMNAIN